MKDVKLLAIGDSSTCFFSGPLPYGGTAEYPGIADVDRFKLMNGFDTVPGVATRWIGPMRVGNLFQENTEGMGRETFLSTLRQALDAGFTGWVLLCGGHLDLANECPFQIKKLGMLEAHQDLIRRYMLFVQELKAIYPRIALWSPPVAPRSFHVWPDNMIVSTGLFTRLLLDAAPADVPVFTVFDLTVDEKGESIPDVFYVDRLHLSPNFLPLVMRMIGQRLNIEIGGGETGMLVDRDVSSEFTLEQVEVSGKRWLMGATESIHHIKRIVLQGPLHYETGEFAVSFNSGVLTHGRFEPPQPWEWVNIPANYQMELLEGQLLEINVENVVEKFMLPIGNNPHIRLQVFAVDYTAQYCHMGDAMTNKQKIEMLYKLAK